jgi:hypothetical protein
VQNKLPKPVKLRPAGAQLYGFGFVINYAHLLNSKPRFSDIGLVCSIDDAMLEISFYLSC